MKKRKFKIAFIGCGARSISYAAPLSQTGEIIVSACAEPDIENLRPLLKYTGVKEKSVHIYSDWRELCEKEQDLDGAVVATPNHLHRGPAESLIRRRIPLALEKPITTTMEDTEAILN
ncbi:MAG: Gfo/Idh/MocA family oxidoreductase, partial [Lentisphaeria bacterium]|nr:Gfo/Idh/MocA family oxidoreductase [Lentisphaeria bacterium]